MAVEITVNWTFIGERDDDAAYLTFGTHHIGGSDRDDMQRDADETDDVFTAVVPLGSSVLARGLSLPLPI